MIHIPLLIAASMSAYGLKMIIQHKRKSQAHTIDQSKLKTFFQKAGIPECELNKSNINLHLPNGNSLIIEALRQHNEEIAIALIKAGADVNAMDSEGKSALFYAESPHMIRALICYGALPNTLDKYGRTPLFYTDHIEIISSLLQNGVPATTKDCYGKTALFYLPIDPNSISHSLSCVSIIVNFCPDILQICDQSGNLPSLVNLPKIAPIDIQTLNTELHKELIYSIETNDNNSFINTLHKNKYYDINKTFTYKDRTYTLLHLAAKHNRPQIIKTLIQEGANINQRIDLDTPVHQAITANSCKAMVALLEPPDARLCARDLNAAINTYRTLKDPECIEHLLKSHINFTVEQISEIANIAHKNSHYRVQGYIKISYNQL